MDQIAVNQLIGRLEQHAAALTIDQRLRLAALLAQPIPNVQTASPVPAEAPPLLLTVNAAAKQLNIGRSAVYDLIRTGQLDSITIGSSRRIRHTASPPTSTTTVRLRPVVDLG